MKTDNQKNASRFQKSVGSFILKLFVFFAVLVFIFTVFGATGENTKENYEIIKNENTVVMNEIVQQKSISIEQEKLLSSEGYTTYKARIAEEKRLLAAKVAEEARIAAEKAAAEAKLAAEKAAEEKRIADAKAAEEKRIADAKAAASISQKNALKKAESYLDFTAFSHDGLVAQLEFEQFSHADAVYAADNCGANWNEQAAKKAKAYLSFMAFSRKGLIAQLEFDKFTYQQAVYGVKANGF
jgi:hypothetical protein